MVSISDYLIKNKNYSIVIIRISLALVLLWFGIDEVLNPEAWFGYIPIGLSQILPISNDIFITLSGIFEIIVGIMLLVGLYTRIIALIVALHLFFIIISVGYNDIGVRDFGLMAMSISLIFSGSGVFSWDNKSRNNLK